MSAVPVCIAGRYDTDWKIIEGNREIYNEAVLCPVAVARRVHEARLHQCMCGGLHGPVPGWVRETLRNRPGPGLRLPPPARTK